MGVEGGIIPTQINLKPRSNGMKNAPRSEANFSSGRSQQNSSRGGRGCGSTRITCFRCGGPNHKADGCCAPNEEVEQYKAFASLQIGDSIIVLRNHGTLTREPIIR